MPFLLLVVAAALALAGCRPAPADAPLFERLSARRTGIAFANRLREDDSVYNAVAFDYVYHGAGVGVGDFDGDGRPDLFFAGNMVSSRLYLNRGRLRFEDVTAAAGLTTDVWVNGVAVADVDGDGRQDLYLSVGGPPGARAGRNRLYLNRGPDARGVPRFAERAAAWGVADSGWSTHAAFLDYDRDGDLDLYVLRNQPGAYDRNLIRPKLVRGEAPSTDRLYRNDGGHFADVSRQAGITVEGYGLGVVASDLDADGWPDLYVSNDFLSNDLVWVNNRDGTFTNRAAEYLTHQAHNGMGVDAADVNGDGRPDLMQVDMLPAGNERRKMMLPGGNYDKFQLSLRLGYEPQYMRNMLQVSDGPGPRGGATFREVGQLAGVHATDWSWAPLFADFDNDGRKDLFVTSGYRRDVTNLDFIVYNQEAGMMGTREARRARLLGALRTLPEVRLPNHLYQNVGHAAGAAAGGAAAGGAGALPAFADRTAAWGLDAPGFSSGAAYADLDGDGDLDLVVNAVDDGASVYENRAERLPGRHFLRVALRGPAGNRGGYGARVVVTAGGARQVVEVSPARGYESTVEGGAHFGLGAAARADSLQVFWPDGAYQLLTDVPAGRTVAVARADARPGPAYAAPADGAPADEAPVGGAPTGGARPLFAHADLGAPALVHEEREVPDFKVTPLLPRRLSRGGPGVAVADVDGDGLDDAYVGADAGTPKRLLRQTAPGRFAPRPLGDAGADTLYEDMGALFFDADGDRDPDLYVVSGGNPPGADSAAFQDRLYVNDGRGRFRRDSAALPRITASGSCVVGADYDRDGDLDLFVCGRVVPGRYPLPARSYLLRNDTRAGGPPRFTDVTEAVAPALARPGLVTGALWTDHDGDGQVDLLLVGEWMPITLVRNRGGRFADVTAAAGLAGTGGWWNSVAGGDFDGDGDTDYLAGNQGLNTRYRATAREPLRVYAADFDDNGSVDPVVAEYVGGRSYPVASRDRLIEQMPGMKGRFRSYRDYARATLDETLTPAERARAHVREATTLATSYVENLGGGRFAVRPLPAEAQAAPTFGILVGDHDGDGALDALLVGNSRAPDTQAGWDHAGTGAVLLGDGRGGFAVRRGRGSGFRVGGEARAVTTVNAAGPLVLVTQTGDSVRAFARAAPAGDAGARAGAPREVALAPLDAVAALTGPGGAVRREELPYGAGYLSQAPRRLRVPPGVTRVVVTDYAGRAREVPLGRAPARPAPPRRAAPLPPLAQR